jgi:hypothetical protein
LTPADSVVKWRSPTLGTRVHLNPWLFKKQFDNRDVPAKAALCSAVSPLPSRALMSMRPRAMIAFIILVSRTAHAGKSHQMQFGMKLSRQAVKVSAKTDHNHRAGPRQKVMYNRRCLYSLHSLHFWKANSGQPIVTDASNAARLSRAAAPESALNRNSTIAA